VYERYAVTSSSSSRKAASAADMGAAHGGCGAQRAMDGHLPVITTTYSPRPVEGQQRTLGTTFGLRQRSLLLNRLVVQRHRRQPRQRASSGSQ